jgi:hypothetical protein
MDILKIIRHVRYLRIYLQMTLKDKQLREKLKVADKNVIYIDTTSEASRDEDDDEYGEENGNDYKPNNTSSPLKD